MRIAIYLIVFIAVVFAVLQISFSCYFNEKIKAELQRAVTQSSQGYKLKINKLEINLFKQSIYIKGFILDPSSNSAAINPSYFASADELNLTSFKLFALLFKRDLIVEKLELINPTGIIYRNTHGNYKQMPDSVQQISIYKLLNKYIHSLTINRIEIENAAIKIFDNLTDSLPAVSSIENELTITEFKINQVAEATGRLFVAEKVELIINNFMYITKDSLYAVVVKRLAASYTDSTLILDSLKLIPNFSRKEFANEAGQQTDRFKMQVSNLVFDGMDVKLFFERNWFIARLLKIDQMNISAYRNKNDLRKEFKVKSLQERIRNIPFFIAINEINISNSFIAYEEVVPGSTSPGKITFNNLKANVSGFTNDTSAFINNSNLVVNASALLMNKGMIKANYNFPLNTTETVFDCSGKLTELPIASLNPMLEPNAHVSIKRGMIDSMVFDFHANNQHATGKMKLIYHHLNLEILSKKNQKSGIVQDIISFLAHRLTIKENNPTKRGEVRITDIHYPRNPNRFIFNYTWKAILSGIKPAIGLPESKNKK